MSMLDAERHRPVMDYIRTLENKVRCFQNAHRRFQLSVFLVGYAAGAVSILLVWQYLH